MKNLLVVAVLLSSVPCFAGDKPRARLSANGKTLSRSALSAKVRQARIVYVGEEHGHVEHHKLQRDILEMMHGAGPVALGVEYFPRSLQSKLDSLSSGKVPFKDFRKTLNWKKVWGHKWAAYEPLFRYCCENRIPIVALNAERALARRVSRKGLKDFSVEELMLLPRMDLKGEAHGKRIRQQLLKVHPMPEAVLQRYYESFTLWDETMASSVRDIFVRDRREKLRVLVVAGRAHIESGTGIPDRVARRMEAKRLIVVCDSTGRLSKDWADVVFSTPKAKLY